MITNRTRLLLFQKVQWTAVFQSGSRVLKNGRIAIYKSGVKIYKVHEKCVFGTPQNEMKHVLSIKGSYFNGKIFLQSWSMGMNPSLSLPCQPDHKNAVF